MDSAGVRRLLDETAGKLSCQPRRPQSSEEHFKQSLIREYGIVETEENLGNINLIVAQVRLQGRERDALSRMLRAAPPEPPRLWPVTAPCCHFPLLPPLQAWAALKPEEQAPFLEHAAGDQRRYAEECRAYEDMQVGSG